jgi:hypothetical protein
MTPDAPRALVLRTWEDFARNTVRLLVQDSTGAVLQEDGTWYRSPDEATSNGKAGVLLPMETVEAIAAAIAEFQGHTSHADTEARVLREWLAVERERVEQVLRQRGGSDDA